MVLFAVLTSSMVYIIEIHRCIRPLVYSWVNALEDTNFSELAKLVTDVHGHHCIGQPRSHVPHLRTTITEAFGSSITVMIVLMVSHLIRDSVRALALEDPQEFLVDPDALVFLHDTGLLS